MLQAQPPPHQPLASGGCAWSAPPARPGATAPGCPRPDAMTRRAARCPAARPSHEGPPAGHGRWQACTTDEDRDHPDVGALRPAQFEPHVVVRLEQADTALEALSQAGRMTACTASDSSSARSIASVNASPSVIAVTSWKTLLAPTRSLSASVMSSRSRVSAAKVFGRGDVFPGLHGRLSRPPLVHHDRRRRRPPATRRRTQ